LALTRQGRESHGLIGEDCFRLEAWSERKKKNIERAMMEKEAEISKLTFQPEINPKSRALVAASPRQSVPVGVRLYRESILRDSKRQQLVDGMAQEECVRKPKINERSSRMEGSADAFTRLHHAGMEQKSRRAALHTQVAPSSQFGTKHDTEVSPRKYHAYPTGFKPQSFKGGVAKGEVRSAIAEPHTYPQDTCGEIYKEENYDYRDSRPYTQYSRYDPHAYMHGRYTNMNESSKVAETRKEGGIYVISIDN